MDRRILNSSLRLVSLGFVSIWKPCLNEVLRWNLYMYADSNPSKILQRGDYQYLGEHVLPETIVRMRGIAVVQVAKLAHFRRFFAGAGIGRDDLVRRVSLVRARMRDEEKKAVDEDGFAKSALGGKR